MAEPVALCKHRETQGSRIGWLPARDTPEAEHMNAAARKNALEEIAQIDREFERATGWGSWMVMAANRRERLVDQLCAAGVEIEHKYQARTADGHRTD